MSATPSETDPDRASGRGRGRGRPRAQPPGRLGGWAWRRGKRQQKRRSRPPRRWLVLLVVTLESLLIGGLGVPLAMLGLERLDATDLISAVSLVALLSLYFALVSWYALAHGFRWPGALLTGLWAALLGAASWMGSVVLLWAWACWSASCG